MTSRGVRDLGPRTRARVAAPFCFFFHCPHQASASNRGSMSGPSRRWGCAHWPPKGAILRPTAAKFRSRASTADVRAPLYVAPGRELRPRLLPCCGLAGNDRRGSVARHIPDIERESRMCRAKELALYTTRHTGGLSDEWTLRQSAVLRQSQNTW